MRTVTRKRITLLFGYAAAAGGLVLPRVGSAATIYFDVDGTTAGLGAPSGQTYDWDATTNGGLWDTAAAGNGTISGWPQGNLPRFAAAAASPYTVTVSNIEQVTGVYVSVASSVIINAVGTGGLQIPSGGASGLIGATGTSLTINAPISGPGSINPNTGGSVFLYGTNSYLGGTSLTSGATLVYYNKSTSFSTGTITNNNVSATSTYNPLLSTGGATVTLPNNFVNGNTSVNATGFNFASGANTPVVSTGTWALGTQTLLLRNNGNSTAPLTLSGVISGAAGLTLSGANGGTINFTAPNIYTGTTTLGVTGATNVTLALGAPNSIATTASLILAGGKLSPGGFNQAMTATTLGMTASATIDFAAGASEIDFANSSGLSWTGTLNFASWNPLVDKVRFGTDANGLNSIQLGQISFNGAGVGTAALTPDGFLVPEPSSVAILLGGSLLLGSRRRRRAH